ncbi:phospholipid hydroperoxide glutathione peroxidase-like [Venturia canescens]|uniref:phospholipid hydroperoxide glutathione peroxidase-like n=1 Tax=Venturia canescens TaxID=32260 RepID=UPI001C9C6947|nr:phospholipid hydroperoxide glutathione peroxidase-like [Venturia canescens]
MASDEPAPMFDQEVDWKIATSIYQFHATDIHGNDVHFSKYEGHVVVVVNVASEDEKSTSEPGTSEEILEYVEQFSSAKFELFQKVDVKGDAAHPLWKWLRMYLEESYNHDITGNFGKFVLNNGGHIICYFGPNTLPSSLGVVIASYV